MKYQKGTRSWTSSSKVIVMRSQAEHPTDEVLEQYSLGQLPEPRSISLEEHLFTCKSCQDRLQQADEYVAAMRTALTELETESQPVEEKETAAFARLLLPGPLEPPPD